MKRMWCALSEGLSYVSLPSGAPQNANLCIRLGTDDMLPYFSKGQIIYVDKYSMPDEMQPGLFYYDGRVYVRQWCIDYCGTLHLLPSNPASGSEKVSIPKRERYKCLFLGRVLAEYALPEPEYK